MFGFFKPAWKSSDPEKRLKALDKLNPQEASDLEVLRDMASHDPDLGVKLAALRRIDDREALLKLYLQEQDAGIQKTLLASLFPAEQSAEQAIATAEQIANARGYDEVARAQYALEVPSTAASEHFLSELHSEAAQMVVALKHKQANKRLAAAEQIHTREGLHRLLKDSRDKQIQHYARAQVKTLREAAKNQQEQRDKVAEVLGQIELLSKTLDTRQFSQRLARIGEQWHSVEGIAEASERSAYNAHLTQCQALEASISEAQTLQHNLLAASEEQQRCLLDLQQLLDTLEADTPHQDIEAALHQIRQQWMQIQATKSADNATQKRYDQLNRQAETRVQGSMSLQEHADELQAMCDALQDLPNNEGELHRARQKLQDLLKRVSWQEAWGSPALLDIAQQRLAALASAQAEWRTHKEKRQKKLFSQIAHVRRELNNGHLKYANRHFQELLSLFAQLEDKEKKAFEGRIEHLQEALDKLQDWHDFTAEPHKEDLCERMEALVGKDIAPDELAERVKAMRREWKEVTAAHVIHDDPLWMRFNQAAERAYAPCHAYFEQQDKVKKDNLEKRRALLKQLQQFVDGETWEQVDWKRIEQAIRSARSEWRQYSPVHLQEAKADQKQFDQLIRKLQSPLDNERKQNRERRKAFIAEAQALLETADARQATQDAKRLQQQWKAIGPTFQSDFHSQWRVFRGTLDKVFERHHAEQESERQAQNRIKQEAEQLLADMEAIPERMASDLNQAKAQFDALQSDFEALPKLPARLHQGLQKRFAAAAQSLAQFVDSYPKRQILLSVDQAYAVAEACHGLEQHQQGSAAEVQRAFAALKPPMPGCHFDHLAKRVSTLEQAPNDEQMAHWGEQLAAQLIELEVLADCPTPEGFREQRRRFQLQALQDQSHNHRHPRAERLVQGMLNCLGWGRLEAAQYEQLMPRLDAVRNAAQHIILSENA